MPTLKSWTSPKTQRGVQSKIAGKGFFATDFIKKGEVLAIKVGHVVDEATLRSHEGVVNDSQIQITDDLYLAPLSDEEMLGSMVYFNHSCEPNAGIQGQVLLVAMRDIESGEELTCDYALHFDDDITNFDCNCQTPSCRKHITGRDWQLPELQKKYDGYFAWFLEQKIKKQRQHG
jgi:uncharacterized protein